MTSGSPQAGHLGFTHDMGLRQAPGGRVEIGSHPRVGRVYCDYPAARAGIVAGDLILSVNDVDSRVSGVLSADRPGLVFDVVIERDEAVLYFTLVAVQHPALRRPRTD